MIKSFFKKAVLALSILPLVSCGGNNSSSNVSRSGANTGTTSSSSTVIDDSPVTLKFWNGFTGKDGDGMNDIVKAFNKAYEGKITIQVDTINWDSLFLKLIQNKGKEKYSPHIVAMGANRLAQMKSKNIIREIDDIVEYTEAKEEDYLSVSWNAGLLGDSGHRYSFPLDVHPTAMFYNKDLISEDEIPTTWEEFEKVCKEKTNIDTGVYGWAIPNMYSITKDIFASMLLQNGTDMLDKDNNAIFNSDKAVEVLNRLQKWKYVDKISPSSVGTSGDLTLFNSGKSVFYFDGPWSINTLKDISPIDIGVAPMPGSTGTNGISYTGSHQFTLIDCTTQDEKIKNACYEFIKFVSQNPLEWAKAGQVTAYKPVHNTDEYKALTELQPFTLEAENAKVGNIDYEYYYECYNYMGQAVANCLNDSNLTAKQSLDSKVNLFKKFLNEQ